jgi:hypothetical protein
MKEAKLAVKSQHATRPRLPFTAISEFHASRPIIYINFGGRETRSTAYAA